MLNPMEKKIQMKTQMGMKMKKMKEKPQKKEKNQKLLLKLP